MKASLAGICRLWLDPWDGPRTFMAERPVLVPVLLTALLWALGGWSVATRLDADASVLRRLDQPGGPSRLSEQEVTDQLVMAKRLAVVRGVASGVLGVPARWLGLALTTLLCGWLLGRPPPFRVAAAAAVVALLPWAVHGAVLALAAARQSALSESAAVGLVPSNLLALLPTAPQRWRGALESVDVFALWSIWLFGSALREALSLRRHQGIACASLLYVLYVAAVRVGLEGILRQATLGGPQ